MSVPTSDIALVLAHVKTRIGDQSEWARWPGGWPDDIEAALVDAVFSAQAVYRSRRGRGIHANVVAWRQKRARTAFTLDALITEIDAAGIPVWARAFGNSQHSPGRAVSATGGPLKAATIRQAAQLLSEHGVNHASDINGATENDVKRALRSVPGIGFATANYFLMLLGAPGVKPDRMIHRFLSESTGRTFTNAEADTIVKEVAELIGAQPHELDHAVWRFESDQARP